jgi:hypothetical protein
MIAVRLLTQEEVTVRLQAASCEKVEPCDVPEHSLWRTAWDYHFLVPELGPDKMCAEYRLNEIIASFEETRPHHH